MATRQPSQSLTIRYAIEGKSENADVRLGDFAAQLVQLQKVLVSFDLAVSSGSRSTDWKVVDLSHSSPATVVLEPTRLAERPDHRALVVQQFKATTSAVLRGEVPQDIDMDVLEELRKLTANVRRKFASISIGFDNERLDITPAFASTIEAHLANTEACEGTVWGALDTLNVHADANVFYIYPEVGRDKIKCKFQEGLLEKARKAIKRRVEVIGTLRFRPTARYPFEVAVRDIDIFPAEADLPLLSSLRGLAPDATDGLKSEDFVRRQRDEWE